MVIVFGDLHVLHGAIHFSYLPIGRNAITKLDFSLTGPKEDHAD